MSAFIVFFHLPALLTKEFISLVPPHRTLINQLLAEHALETYAISADRGARLDNPARQRRSGSAGFISAVSALQIF